MPKVDASGFLFEEIKNAKEEMRKAVEAGDYKLAAERARRVAELLRALAKVRGWGREGLLRLAREYEALAERYEHSKPHSPTRTSERRKRVSSSGGSSSVKDSAQDMDQEFEVQAEALIRRASVSWRDIAGLEEVKRSLIEALFYSLARPDDPTVKVEPPRRFLLYGPPGTGKTMLAMAASNMLGATFMYVSVDRVLSKYVGDSPRMVSAIFRVARRKAPSIVFFDEVETLMMKRDTGREAAAGLVQTLLTELDGFTSKTMVRPVIVIAATNKPWLLDEAVLSRFERRIYVPLPDKAAREQIFRLNLEKRGFSVEGVTYEELAEATEGYSGRDIANVCKEAVMSMLRRANPDIYSRFERIESAGTLKDLKYRVLPIRREELFEAIGRIRPAVSREDIRKYEEWARSHGG